MRGILTSAIAALFLLATPALAKPPTVDLTVDVGTDEGFGYCVIAPEAEGVGPSTKAVNVDYVGTGTYNLRANYGIEQDVNYWNGPRQFIGTCYDVPDVVGTNLADMMTREYLAALAQKASGMTVWIHEVPDDVTTVHHWVPKIPQNPPPYNINCTPDTDTILKGTIPAYFAPNGIGGFTEKSVVVGVYNSAEGEWNGLIQIVICK